MVEFEVIEITQKKQSILIEIEISETRERKKFSYPMNEGWDNIVRGQPRFLINIARKLQDEEDSKEQVIDLSKFKELAGIKINSGD